MLKYVQRDTRMQLCWPNIRICACIFSDLNHRQDVICIVLCSCSDMLAFVFLLLFSAIIEDNSGFMDVEFWTGCIVIDGNY